MSIDFKNRVKVFRYWVVNPRAENSTVYIFKFNDWLIRSSLRFRYLLVLYSLEFNKFVSKHTVSSNTCSILFTITTISGRQFWKREFGCKNPSISAYNLTFVWFDSITPSCVSTYIFPWQLLNSSRWHDVTFQFSYSGYICYHRLDSK